MSVADPMQDDRPRLRDRIYAWRTGLLRSDGFQRWAARTPIAARVARKDGEALFDLVAGFLHSQVLMAFVDLDLADHLSDRPRSVEALSLRVGVAPDRLRVLCQAASALGLMQRTSDGRYGLGRLGAALPGIPGLAQMIRHHDVLYRDMADPVAFFRDAPATELAAFWPYVFGASGKIDPEVAATYSQLMADSQTLVAQEALAARIPIGRAMPILACIALPWEQGARAAPLRFPGIFRPLVLSISRRPRQADLSSLPWCKPARRKENLTHVSIWIDIK